MDFPKARFAKPVAVALLFYGYAEDDNTGTTATEETRPEMHIPGL